MHSVYKKDTSDRIADKAFPFNLCIFTEKTPGTKALGPKVGFIIAKNA